jgi:hypothetical protein
MWIFNRRFIPLETVFGVPLHHVAQQAERR